MKRLFHMQMVAYALVMLMATGCAEDSLSTMTDGRMTFRVGDIIDNAGWTKGAQATLNAMDAGFGVSCSLYPSSASYSNSPCGSFFYNIKAAPNIATDYYWPQGGSKMAFYAYYPYGNSALKIKSAAADNGIPTYSYTVPQSIAAQVDVMTANVMDRATDDHSTVSLSFTHRCTGVRFLAYNQTSEPLTVKSVALYGVKYSGTYTDGTTWTLTGNANSRTSYPFVLTTDTTVPGDATIDLTGTTNHLFMLPQTVPAGTDFIEVKTLENGEDVTYTYTLEQDYQLVMGKCVIFQLTLGNNKLIVDPVTVTDWVPNI